MATLTRWSGYADAIGIEDTATVAAYGETIITRTTATTADHMPTVPHSVSILVVGATDTTTAIVAIMAADAMVITVVDAMVAGVTGKSMFTRR